MAISNRTQVMPKKRRWRGAAVLFIILVGLYGIVPQLSIFKHSLSVAKHATLPYVFTAAAIALLSYGAAAASYYSLAYPRLRFGRTVIVEFACTFVNRLLPGGVGGIGANYVYLRKAQLTPATAAAMVAINNILGFMGHGLLLIIGLIVFRAKVPSLSGTISKHSFLYLVVGVVAVSALFIASWMSKKRLQKGIVQLGQQLTLYRKKPLLPLASLLSSMLITTTTVSALWVCCLALHVSLSLVSVFIIFSFGLAVGTATPTPGGLGGFEAGIVAGFIGYHVASDRALAIALVFRLISFWVPLLLGAIAFAYSRKRKFI